MADIGVPITQTIIPPVISVPNNGYKKIEPNDFNEIGNLIFFRALNYYVKDWRYNKNGF